VLSASPSTCQFSPSAHPPPAFVRRRHARYGHPSTTTSRARDDFTAAQVCLLESARPRRSRRPLRGQPLASRCRATLVQAVVLRRGSRSARRSGQQHLASRGTAVWLAQSQRQGHAYPFIRSRRWICAVPRLPAVLPPHLAGPRAPRSATRPARDSSRGRSASARPSMTIRRRTRRSWRHVGVLDLPASAASARARRSSTLVSALYRDPTLLPLRAMPPGTA